MNCKSICLTISLFCFFSSLAPAQALQLCGKAKQGEILVGHADKGESIVFNKQKLRMSPSGEFLIAFGRDDKKTQYLTLTDSQNSSYRVKLEVSPAAWDIQNLKGIPPRKVTPLKLRPPRHRKRTVFGTQSTKKRQRTGQLAGRIYSTGQGTYQRKFRRSADYERSQKKSSQRYGHCRAGRHPR